MAKANASKKTVQKNQPDAKTTAVAASSLSELFLSSLRSMYWTENHITVALPKMIRAASTPELQQALTEHLKVTEGQAARLENIFEALGEHIVAQKCDAAEGLTMDGEHIIENTLAGSEARETGLIMGGRKVENFEITCYTGMIEVAQTLGLTDVASQLQQSLQEEQESDARLAAISQNLSATRQTVNE